MNGYPTDLTDTQYELIKDYFDTGRKVKWPVRKLLDAVFYLLKSGTQWRMLPNDLPPWQTVYWYYRKWSGDGTLELAHENLRRATRAKAGKKETCTAALIDSQSVKSSPSGWGRGYDAAKGSMAPSAT